MISEKLVGRRHNIDVWLRKQIKGQRSAGEGLWFKPLFWRYLHFYNLQNRKDGKSKQRNYTGQIFNHRFKCVCAVADKANTEKYTLPQVINMPGCTIMMTEHLDVYCSSIELVKWVSAPYRQPWWRSSGTSPPLPPPSRSQTALGRFHTTARECGWGKINYASKSMDIWIQSSQYVTYTLSYLFYLVLSGLHTLDLLLFSCSLILLNLNLILFLKELTFGSFLQVSDLLKLYPVLKETNTYTTMICKM